MASRTIGCWIWPGSVTRSWEERMLYSFVKVLLMADINVFVDGGRNKKSCQTFRN